MFLQGYRLNAHYVQLELLFLLAEHFSAYYINFGINLDAFALVISYFNWIWQHSCLGTTAAQRAELTDHAWTWNDIATYPTLL
jgi:hypothetical protein